ncbi:MAG: epoxyqueuosine reductase QueH [Candidatus Riflebacteria bacterium]|nr:epoxyqueuosine reductase QueH [Candidatus Riflebacteria bacterium]
MKILLHTCCGPCLGGSIQTFINENHQITAFWENPNIHGFFEFRNRFESFCKIVKQLGIPTILGSQEFLPELFFKTLEGKKPSERCFHCFKLRLSSTAKVAAQMGFDSFCTTLLISPYQKREYLLKAGREAAEEFNISFFETDLRNQFPRTHQAIRDYELYKQKYCGCIFSEKERFSGMEKFNFDFAKDLKKQHSQN